MTMHFIFWACLIIYDLYMVVLAHILTFEPIYGPTRLYKDIYDTVIFADVLKSQDPQEREDHKRRKLLKSVCPQEQ
jgi:hypothetical protein